MSRLVAAMQVAENNTTTANGMATYKSSLDACVDFFFQAGASRGKDITGLFAKAFNEDKELAVRLSLWLRDVRGGAGERSLFKDCFKYILSKDTQLALRVLKRVPELGRWDDVLVAFDTTLEADALEMITTALLAGDALCAKWMPRQSGKVGRCEANKIRKALSMTPREYRALLVSTSNTVEQKMCAKRFDTIEYSHVPSLAAARYQAAFAKADPIGYTTYREGLKSGAKGVKVNAGAVYPYDVVKSLWRGDVVVADAQWKALPDYMNGSTENILAMVDASGSMTCSAGGMSSVTCLDVALSLGLYISERNSGIFKDAFMTFSDNPQIVTVRGSLSDKLNTMGKCNWYQGTNLEKAFVNLLTVAVQAQLQDDEMPTQIVILSDMQFNQGVQRWNANSIEMITDLYAVHGYKMPKIVYWNINAASGQSPVTADKFGTALVSGFSPAIMATVLGADPEEFTPRAMMVQAVSVPRYAY